MNRAEAIIAMRKGEKITHTYFGDEEWVKSNQSGVVYIFEDGCKCSDREFWKYRTDESWNDGWEYFIK